MSTLLESRCEQFAEDHTVKQSLQECDRRMTTIEHRETRWAASRVIVFTTFTAVVVLIGLAIVGCIDMQRAANPQAIPPVLPEDPEDAGPVPLIAAPADSPRPWSVIPMPAPQRHFGIDEQSQQEMLNREYRLDLGSVTDTDLAQLRYDVKILKIQVRELQQAVFRMKTSMGSSRSPAGSLESPLQFTIGIEPAADAPAATKD